MKSDLNESIRDEYKFAEETSHVIIPVIMFLLNVLSNSLAIICLLRYRFRSKMKSSRGCIDIANEGRSSVTDAFNYGDKQVNCDCRPKKKKKRKFAVFHTLVSVLAILDLLGSICTGPLTFILYAKEMHIEAYGGESVCYYSAFAMLFFGFTSMAMVMGMSIERLLSIRYAFLYHRKATARKALLLVLVMLIASAVLCASPVFGFGAVKAMYPYSWCFANWNAELYKDKAFNYLYVSLSLVMFAITLTCNGMVISGLLRMREKLNSRRKRKKMCRETQMIIQLLSITCIFAICWLPLMFRILVNQLELLKSLESDRIAIWLAAVNPILDPWVYILCRMSVFRRLNNRIKSFRSTGNSHSSTCQTNLEKNKLNVRLKMRRS